MDKQSQQAQYPQNSDMYFAGKDHPGNPVITAMLTGCETSRGEKMVLYDGLYEQLKSNGIMKK